MYILTEIYFMPTMFSVRTVPWLAKVALVVWACSLSFSSFSSPTALLSAAAVEVTAPGKFDIACDNSMPNSKFSDSFSKNSGLTPFEAQNFGMFGSAFSSTGLSWSACSGGSGTAGSTTNVAAGCSMCERDTTRRGFVYSDNCYLLAPPDLTASDFFGFAHLPAFANEGRSWSICSSGRDSQTGTCYVCDRADENTKFEWSTHCYMLAPADGEEKDVFGGSGATWTKDGLSWSACKRGTDHSGGSPVPKPGVCHVCRRDTVDTNFVWGDHCYTIGPAADVDFGMFGVDLSDDGLSLSACTSTKTVNGVSQAGTCYVCDRADATTQFVWDDHCYTLVSPDVAENDAFGFFGARWGNDALSWSTCSNGAFKCYVCHRADVKTRFDWSTHCYPLTPAGLTLGDNFGSGGPAWSQDGLSWSACAPTKTVDGKAEAGECYVCGRGTADADTRFVMEDDCFWVAPNEPDHGAGDRFGSFPGALRADGLEWAFCSPTKTHSLGTGTCFICKYICMTYTNTYTRGGGGVDFLYA